MTLSSHIVQDMQTGSPLLMAAPQHESQLYRYRHTHFFMFALYESTYVPEKQIPHNLSSLPVCSNCFSWSFGLSLLACHAEKTGSIRHRRPGVFLHIYQGQLLQEANGCSDKTVPKLIANVFWASPQNRHPALIEAPALFCPQKTQTSKLKVRPYESCRKGSTVYERAWLRVLV